MDLYLISARLQGMHNDNFKSSKKKQRKISSGGLGLVKTAEFPHSRQNL
jgi:hypothetical protein